MKLILLLLLTLTSCASMNSTSKAKFVDQANPLCLKTGKLYSEAFSIIPFLAPEMAKSILSSKANDIKANTVVIDKEEGFFHVKYQASGYRCN